MNARTQRTLLRLGASLAILVVAVIIVQFVHDEVLRTAAVVLAGAAIASLEEFLRNSGTAAAPTVDAVNTALEQNSVVPPPKVRIPDRSAVVAESPDVPDAA